MDVNPIQQASQVAPQPTGPINPAEPPAQPSGDENPLTKADYSLMNKVIRTALIESSNNVEILRSDPNSPLYSVKKFEDLNLDEALLRGIYDMGFKKPSKIQETALPILITQRRNIIAQSQSGTGKTAAFLLASLSRVDTTQQYPQVVILSPTYELACQTFDVAKRMAKFKTDITFRKVVKGEEVSRDKWTEHVLIGTPGRMSDCTIKFQNVDLKRIRVFVLDEADVMIHMQGHDVKTSRMRKALSPDCQILLFSATYEEKIRQFASTIVPNATEIHLRREEESLANIKQHYVYTRTEEEKYSAMAQLYGTLSIGQAIIFCQTKRAANYLTQRLIQDGHMVGLINGDLTVEQRNQVLLDFKEGRQRTLIATNVIARGLDIDQVSVVVNYELPLLPNSNAIDKETYLHRIGRTGRFGRDGLAINFITMDQKKLIDELVKTFGQPINELNVYNYDELNKLDE